MEASNKNKQEASWIENGSRVKEKRGDCGEPSDRIALIMVD